MNHLKTPVISIDPNLCKHDGLCARLCPVQIFNGPAGAVPQILHAEECCLCGQCVAGCPGSAIRHSGFEATRLRPVDPAGALSPETALAFLAQRRSVRNYKKDAPPRELLEEIISAAAYAPASPHHRVGWVREFIVVSGPEAMQQVLKHTAEYVRQSYRLLNSWLVRGAAKFDASARAGLEVAPDLGMRLKEYQAGKDLITYQAPAAIFAIAPQNSSMPQTDCDAALYTVLLLAQAYGLGTCWNGLLQGAAAGDHLNGFTQLSQFLKIPPGYKCYAAATIGYPAIKLQRLPTRAVGITWI